MNAGSSLTSSLRPALRRGLPSQLKKAPSPRALSELYSRYKYDSNGIFDAVPEPNLKPYAASGNEQPWSGYWGNRRTSAYFGSANDDLSSAKRRFPELESEGLEDRFITSKYDLSKLFRKAQREQDAGTRFPEVGTSRFDETLRTLGGEGSGFSTQGSDPLVIDRPRSGPSAFPAFMSGALGPPQSSFSEDTVSPRGFYTSESNSSATPTYIYPKLSEPSSVRFTDQPTLDQSDDTAAAEDWYRSFTSFTPQRTDPTQSTLATQKTTDQISVLYPLAAPNDMLTAYLASINVDLDNSLTSEWIENVRTAVHFSSDWRDEVATGLGLTGEESAQDIEDQVFMGVVMQHLEAQQIHDDEALAWALALE